MMVKVLIYGYATGTFSSRKLAAKLHEDVALARAGGRELSRRTARCRTFGHCTCKSWRRLFVQVVRLARECGLVKLGTVAVDGTKLKANASRHKAMSYERMLKAEAELKAQIDGLLNRAKAADDLEKNEPEIDIPSEIKRRADRLAAITAAKLRLEQRQQEADAARGRSKDDQRKPRDKDGKPKGGRYKRDFGVPKDSAQESFTDTDSRIMKRAGGGFDYSYNAHTAVDEAAQIVVAAELSNNAADSDRLPVLLAAVRANLGRGCRSGAGRCGFPLGGGVRAAQGQPERADRGAGARRQAGAQRRRRTAPAHRGHGCQAEDARRQGGLPQEEVDRGGAQRLDQERAGVQAVQFARTGQGQGRVQARVSGAQPEEDVQFASNLRENGASRAAKRSLQTRTRPLHRPRKTTGTIKSPEAPRSCPQISPRNVLPRRLLGGLSSRSNE
jgi:hypothetical protein